MTKRILNIPFIKAKVDKETGVVIEKIQNDIIVRMPGTQIFGTLPAEGMSNKDVITEMSKYHGMKRTFWEKGRVSGAVYHGGKELTDLQSEAFSQFTVANQLHPDVFPGVRKMESEVVAMVLALFHGPEGSCGTSTSGGTESLLLTSLAAKMKAYNERGVTHPEIIAPITVHAGFDKAAYYFGMKLRHAPVDPKTMKVDLRAVRRMVTKNTVLLVGSAPNYPHGIIDDIEGLSDIALKHKIPLHVDACLGSFIVPYLERAGFDKILFDFRVPGVTSISCDTHKYGFAPKGSSIIMYRTSELRHYQYFVAPDWVGGIYGSPTLAGSRPGAIMVGCWATMLSVGDNGYLQSCKEIVGAARKFRKAVDEEIPDLQIVGDPRASVIAFNSDSINIYDLSDAMSKKGWHLSTLQNPAAAHVAFTKPAVPAVDDLVADLKSCIAEMKKAGNTKVEDGTAAFYGVAGSIKTAGVADRLVCGFLDGLYKL